MNFLEALTQAENGIKVCHNTWDKDCYIHFKNGLLTDRNYDSENTIRFDRRHTDIRDNRWELYEDTVTFESLNPGDKFTYNEHEYQKLRGGSIANAFNTKTFYTIGVCDSIRVRKV